MILSNASLKRPVAMTALIFLMLVFGAFSYFRLGLDFLPRMDFPYITVMTVYPGAGPEEVESLVARHIEDAVSEVDGVKHINSISMDNMSQVLIEFKMGTDVDVAANDVREKVELVKHKLPDDAETPTIVKFDPNASPIMTLVLTGNRPLDELYHIADDQLVDRLVKIPGVAAADIIGGRKREIQIMPDQNRLEAYSLTMMSIVGALARDNIQVPSGHITEPGLEYTIKLDGEYNSVDEIRDIDIQTPFGKTIKITDVATVVDGFEEVRDIARYNRRECVGLILKKRSDANTVAVAKRVRASLDGIRSILPPETQIKIVDDSSLFIKDSANDVMVTIFFGIILTAIILMLFLHDFKQMIIAATSIPVSIISTFSLLYFAGFTLNVMSLMALGLGVGILVTNAIVVLENIERHLAMKEHDTVWQAVSRGTGEVAVAVLGTTLTNVVVFLPIVFITGIAGQMFVQFGMTMVFATLVSMFISFTLTPILARMLLKKADASLDENGHPVIKGGFGGWWEKQMDTASTLYKTAVNWSLNNRLLVGAIALSIFIATLSLVPHLGTEFISEPDQGKLSISIEMPAGTPINKTLATFKDLEERIQKEYGDITTGMFVKIGKIESTLGKSSEGVYLGAMQIQIVDKNQREPIKVIMARIRESVADIPATKINVSTVAPVGGGTMMPIQLEIYGDDFDTLGKLTQKIIHIANRTEGAVDVDTSWRPGKPEIRITPKRERIKDHGLTVAGLAMLLRMNVQGTVASKFRVGGDEYDIRVKLDKMNRDTVEQVRQFRIPVPSGGTVPLFELADISQTLAPTQILRKDKQRYILVTSNTSERPLGDVVNDIQSRIDELGLPSGYSTFMGGMVERMNETFADLGMVFVMAVILTYFALAALLESWVQPFSIMLTLPLALVGVFLALFITGNPVSMFGLMAVVMLVGIVVNNAILIIDYTTNQRNAGISRRDALLKACPIKLRPILMTTVAMIIAMLPIALGYGWGAEIRAPMAIVTIGGLTASTILSLIVIPVMYTVFDDITAAWTRRKM